MPNLSPQEFVSRWRGVELTERSASQQHFLDLCSLVGHKTPVEADPRGDWFTFEYGSKIHGGGSGWADVWKKGHFGWEYKGKHKDLAKAYDQLLNYRESLQNPPLLVVSDMDRILIHTNFTNSVKQVIEIAAADLIDPAVMNLLRAVFNDPDSFRAPQTTEQVTQEAATEFAKLAEELRSQGAEPHQAAHFLIRLLFCLFAEDIGLLPKKLFSDLAKESRNAPAEFTESLRELFAKMSKGGKFGRDKIAWFNGGLFDDDNVLELSRNGIEALGRVCDLDWSSIEPSIFGTLFERSLDPSKRSQLGAHYTSKEDILLIVEPVLMAPLRRRWEEVQGKADELKRKLDEAPSKRVKQNRLDDISTLLRGFADEIAKVTVLDPACGSGNFLYVSLKQLLDLQKEIITYAGRFGLPSFFPTVSPAQLHGIEINAYAHELAQATIQIGYIQWLNDNGFGRPAEPILQRLDTIENKDAILEFDEDGKAVEPEWPATDVIIGNPPFLGGNKIRQELGDPYVDTLFRIYEGRVPAFADLVCYWFEKSRHTLQQNKSRRAGLIATNSIRGGANRYVLERIRESGDIFLAWSDRPWVLNGAAVRVSIIAFGREMADSHSLNGHRVEHINPDLTASFDLTTATRLTENHGLAYMGMSKKGPFELTNDQAKIMLKGSGNPNGRDNADVVRQWANGIDVTRRPRKMWIIDFGAYAQINAAAEYEKPFEYVKAVVLPIRSLNNRKAYRERWWLHAEPRPALRKKIAPLKRYIATPTISKHRLFVWLETNVVPDQALISISRDDDYFFGVLHSHLHESWALRMGTSLEDRPRYTPTTTFETFPFPWPPGKEPNDDPRVEAIAAAAKDLVEKRDNWLNPPGATDAELKKRTLTNLYNQRPTWLDMLHKKLDNAVFDAYGWQHDLSDEEILEKLLALNLERSQT